MIPMNEQYLSDLDRCDPACALSSEGGNGVWRTLPYETQGFTGTMLLAGDETSAAEVTYHPKRNGWYRLSVGLCPSHGPTTILIRLSDDDSFAMLKYDPALNGELPGHADTLYELEWKIADLTGRDIVLSQIGVSIEPGQTDGPKVCEKAAVAYIKAVPMSDEEALTLRVDRLDRTSKCLFAHNDAHGYIYRYRPSTKEEVWRELEPYRDSDFSRIYWEAGMGDLLYYLGEKGRLCTCNDMHDFFRQGDRFHAETWRNFRDTGLDPFRVARDRARDIGLEFHAAYRTAGFFFPPPYDQWNTGGLYGTSPELRSTGRDGTVAPRLSYTYPEVRRFAIDLLSEVADIGVDGICLLYNRRPPLVDYDPPLVEAFIEKHGIDPRELPEDDARWLDVKSEPLTMFMRELRESLGDDAHISACVSNRRENRLYGMDVETWIREGLIDTLIPYTSAPELDSAAESWPEMDEVEYFVRLTEDTKCLLSMNVMPRFMSPEAYRRKAAALYENGVDSLFFWDSAGGSGRANFSPSWSEVCRLGHRGEIGKWKRAGEPAITREIIEMTSYGSYDLSYQTPG